MNRQSDNRKGDAASAAPALAAATPIVLLSKRLADLAGEIERTAEDGDREQERALYRRALLLEATVATAPAETLNDVGLKLGLLLDCALCGGIREQVQTHHVQAIETAMAYLLMAAGRISEQGAQMLHMDAVATHRRPEGGGTA